GENLVVVLREGGFALALARFDEASPRARIGIGNDARRVEKPALLFRSQLREEPAIGVDRFEQLGGGAHALAEELGVGLNRRRVRHQSCHRALPTSDGAQTFPRYFSRLHVTRAISAPPLVVVVTV